MTILGKKRVAWVVMSGGAGAALLFGVVIWLNGRGLERHEWPAYAWPVVGSGAAIFGWRWLRALYRREPPVPPAAWTVSLADLIFATLFAGVCSAVVTADPRFKVLTPLIALAGFALYLGSALAASLHGVTNSASRPAYVVSHACATLGVMGLVSLVLVVCVLAMVARLSDIPDFFTDLLGFDQSVRDWMVILRVMLCALPVGLTALGLLKVAGVGKKEAPQQ